jgi:hypothetical protein
VGQRASKYWLTAKARCVRAGKIKVGSYEVSVCCRQGLTPDGLGARAIFN